MNILLSTPEQPVCTVAIVMGDENSTSALDRLPKRTYQVVVDSKLPEYEQLEQIRKACYDVCDFARKDKVNVLCLDCTNLQEQQLFAAVEGLSLANYSFDRFKSDVPSHIETLYVPHPAISQAKIDECQRLMNRIFWCREWVNLPVANLNAEQFADELAAVAHDLKIKCTVFDKKQLQSLRMGGLLAVNKGSVDEPRFVLLEYFPENSDPQPIALVGKGIMYDTGGLNIKPDDYMCEMKSDMAGAATMASVLFAAADNNLPVHLVALLPLTDNRPGFNAYAADDILTMYDGTSVEIVNTDAEGRLILADAIAFAAANYNPSLIIDAATLTGAAVRAISTFGIAAMHQNAAEPMARLEAAGNEVHERIAQFPFWNEYGDLIKSEVADIKNCGPAQAGTITAGKFLAHFAKRFPFIHLDIAGVAYFSKPQAPFRIGASGYGIRLLYRYLKSLKTLKK